MQLSRRLEAICAMAGSGECAADIGTDHGYVPLELIRREQFRRCIAMDVRKGPLMRAQAHIEEARLQDRIETRMSNGFQALKAGEADTAVIAGMGGPLMIQLLTEGAEVTASIERLILSPQSEVVEFHRYLMENGYRVEGETWVEDDNKHYVVMKVIHGSEEPWNELELNYGRLPLRKTPGDLAAHLEREIRTATQVLEHLASLTGDSAAGRRDEMQHRLAIARQALEELNTGG